MPEQRTDWFDADDATALLDLLLRHPADLTTFVSAEGAYLYASPASVSLLGWAPEVLIGRTADDFVHPDDVAGARLARSAALGSSDAVVTSQRSLRSDGSYVWTETTLRKVTDNGAGGGMTLLGSTRDIADRKLMEAKLVRPAFVDPLTGLANRIVLMDRLSQSLRRLERRPSLLAVVYFNLDQFMAINESLGRSAGDEVLARVAERAIKVIRPGDTVARIGGDKFVMVAEELTDVGGAVRLAERLCAELAVPFDLDGRTVGCTASAGVATTSDPRHSPQSLLGEADVALYWAKDRGGNRVEVYDDDLGATAAGRLSIEAMVRRAIDDDRLEVRYQPIIDLRTGQVTAAEALVRVQGPDGLVNPDAFLTVAEEAGLLVSIDEWVLGQAARQAAVWQREVIGAAFGGIAINITGRHLAEPRLAQMLGAALADHGLAAGSLSVEVNERVLMEASMLAMDGLRAIRSLGVGVGLDDFLTGYSSVAHLRRFPLDFVKLDHSFVSDLGPESNDVAVVAAIIDLAHALGLWVVAEGIETGDQLRILRDLGCDRGQGFAIGAPAEAATVTALIQCRASRIAEESMAQ